MIANITRSLIILLGFLLCSTTVLGKGGKDSIAVLPMPEMLEVEPMYNLLDGGKHPADFHFAVENATPDQVRAWLEGDFDQLDGTYLMDELVSNRKGDFFANAQENISIARQTIAKVEEIGNFISQFDGSSLITLPVGMEKTLDDGTQVFVVIDRISLYPTNAEVAVYARVKTPRMIDPIFFGSPDIQFSRKSGVKTGSLGLLGDIKSKIFEEVATLEFKGAKVQEDEFVTGVGTYVKFDCDGLSEFSLDVDLAFNREVIKPANIQDTTGVVRATLNILASDTEYGLNDLLIDITIDQPFVSPKKEDVIFTASQIVFDFSELQHESTLLFPVADYTPDVPDIALWQGVYIREISVQLPAQLVGTNGPDLIAINDVIIDQTGFTGFVSLAPVLALNQGKLESWSYSIDSLQLHFYQNNLAAFDFDGLISIPLLNDDANGAPTEASSIAYAASFDWQDNSYSFETNFTEDQVYTSKMLKASVTLYPTSNLLVSYEEASGFEVKATLHGSLSIDANVGSGQNGLSLQVPDVTFQNVTIANRDGFIRNGGTWNVDTIAVNVGNFDMMVTNIGMVPGAEANEAYLQFQSFINLGASKVDLSAAGSFRIVGKIEETSDGHQNWRFDRFVVDALFIDCETAAFEFDGYVIFFDEIETYGKGFQGKLGLTLKSLKGDIGFEAMGLFGKADAGYRYFMVDVMAKFPAAMINVAGLDIRAIGGGVYVNMRQEALTSDFTAAPTEEQIQDYDGTPVGLDNYKEAIEDLLGESLSGTRYVPDESYALGITAGIVVATPDEETFNANVRFYVEFTDAAGLAKVGLRGYANVMAPISWSGPSCEGVSIEFDMRYESGNANDTGEGRFIAEAKAYVNVSGIRGATPQAGGDCSPLYYAGGIDILISKSDWYINIGVPESAGSASDFPGGPIQLELVDFNIMASAYLDIGTNIPPFPGLPDNVAELTGLGNLLQDENTRASGNGFAFGVRMVMDNNIDAWGIVEADIYLDVGFDIMLQRYQDVLCVNNNNQPLGINGWYAAGQAWVYVEGSLKVLGFEVMSAGIAAAIQVKGPKPFYGRGAVVGRYSVMGGLAKGDFRFPLEFGQECELEDGQQLELDLNIISGILPLDATSNVPVETKPIIEFSYPVNEVVELSLDGENSAYYMIQLDEFEVQTEAGQAVAGDWVWSESAYVIEFQPREILDGEAVYVILATASLYGTSDNGSISGGPIQTEMRTHTFTTGPSLENIPLANVAGGWPANGQFSYYQGEPVDNFIQLSAGQDDLFLVTADNRLEIHLTDGLSDTPIIVPYNYSSANNKISFDLPSLTPETNYKAEVKVISGGAANDFAPPSSGGIGGGFDSFFDLVDDEEKVLLTYYFRVSAYNTLAEKLNSVSIAVMENDSYRTYTADINGLVEPFGQEEIVGLAWLPSTLSVDADLENTSWMDQFFSIDVPDEGTLNLYTISVNNDGVNYTVADLDYDIPSFGVTRQFFANVPAEAVSLVQPCSNTFIITADNYKAWNEVNQDPSVDVYQIMVDSYQPYFYYAVPKIVVEDYWGMQELVMDNDLAASINSSYNAVYSGSCDGYNTSFECCNGNSDFMTSLYNSMSSIYNNQQLAFRFFYTLVEPVGNQCITYLIQERYINTELTTGSSYPINVNYQFASSTGGSETIDLQY